MRYNYHMKNKKKQNIKVYFVFIIVLAFSIYCYLHFTKKEIIIRDNHEYQANVTNNTNHTINTNIERLIIKYINTYYRSLKELKSYDVTSFFNDPKSNNALLSQTALDVLIDSRNKQLNDLSLKNVKYDITYTKIEEKDNITYIELTENSYQDFSFMDSTSKVYNVLNTFEIEKVNDTYKIKSFYREQGYFIMVDNIDKDLNEIKENYSTIFDNKLENQTKMYNDYLNNKNKEFKSCDNEYDRSKALNYAQKYVTERNHADYGPYGGNCQNYASWALNEGGIPMDIEGAYQWKHYGESVNEKNTKSGRSTSWTGVNEFYKYAKNNTGYGLCSEIIDNTYYADIGDIIQVGYKDIYSHTTIVTGSVIKDGNTIDILLNSNTGDLENFPLSAYAYPNKRLIKILGWNN